MIDAAIQVEVLWNKAWVEVNFCRFDIRLKCGIALSLRRALIFDEATSALDAESESIIHNYMKAMGEGRTVLIIAHRLSVLRHAHRIITMENGEVTESGTHHELLVKNGRYASLWREQMGQMTGEVG